MTLRNSLSSSADRTHPPSISHLMQTALENPEIVSLAAGFVDQRSLPVEIAARAAADLLGDPGAGRRSLQYGTTIGDQSLRARLIEGLERGEGRPAGLASGIRAGHWKIGGLTVLTMLGRGARSSLQRPGKRRAQRSYCPAGPGRVRTGTRWSGDQITP